MSTVQRLRFGGATVTLGLVLALVALVIASNTPVHASSHPDLEVGTPSVDDSSPYTGASFTLSATVTNAGDGESVATTLRYYRSTDATITTSDTEEGTDAVGALAAAGTSDQSIDLTAPSTAGTYYYGACVDSVTGESNTTDNCSASVTVTVKARPDMALEQFSVDGSPSPGGSFALIVYVSNRGFGQSGATTLRYYQSTDMAISPSMDTQVGTLGFPAIGPRHKVLASIGLTAPSTVGTYYYGVCVDPVTDESDTSNNCSSSVSLTVKNTPPTGAPTISGTAQVGQTLTASTSGISDADGLTNVTYNYQWLADNTEIDGATSSTYTVQSTDNGKVIKVRVTFTDDAASDESLTSTGTSLVVMGGL